jgi:hypothetical protein
MSTRCQVIIKDECNELWFYRHSDGYPKGALPTLTKFMKWVKEGKIRNNVEQASGWLILIGAEEYNSVIQFVNGKYERVQKPMEDIFNPNPKDIMGWKVGAYEPSMPRENGDIEYLYTLNLEKLTISIKDISTGKTIVKQI